MEQKTELFRISANIYANNNYEISPKQIHKKIIENALLLMGDEGFTIGEIQHYISTNYSLSFSDEEIRTTLQTPNNTSCFRFVTSEADVKYSLSPSRRLHLEEQNKKKNLHDFIDEYLSLQKMESSNEDIINRFFYDMFDNNVAEFTRLFCSNRITEGFEHIKRSESKNDIEIINGFLDWDNPEKDIAIFKLANYALEYCLITNKKQNSIKLDLLKNKIFYLDTNILYRAIGINGKDRQLRTQHFFDKIKNVGNKIFITSKTIEEFETSITQYVKKLNKTEAPAVNSRVYTEYVTYDDIYRYYHEWASKRHNADVSMFKAYLTSEFENFCRQYDIEKDNRCPFVENEEKEILEQYAREIRGLSDQKTFDTAYIDAYNATWIERLRAGQNKSIFSTKHYLLSSDFKLHFWDVKYHSLETPIVIHPAEWLSILLRYVERTNDDYKSFVCFLNIKSQEPIISDEQMNVILAGIAETTSDVEQQRGILECIITDEFKNGIKQVDNANLKQMSKKYAERKMQEMINDLNEKLSTQMLETQELKESFQTSVTQVESQDRKTKQLEEKILSQEETINKMDSILKGNTIDSIEKDRLIFTLRKYLKLVFIIPLWLVIIGLVIYFFCSSKEDSSIMGVLLSAIENLDDTQKYVARGCLLLFISAILIPLTIYTFKVVFKKFES